jgi:hypothetical protein
MGGKKDLIDPRFIINYAGNAEYHMDTRSSDGQLMFLVNKLSKMKQNTPFGSRIAEVHNGSSLFTGDAGQGESNIRRWIIENDWLEAIIALPLDMFYNTNIATYIWVLTNRKPAHRKGKIQLINATELYKPLSKNLGKKNCELSEEDIKQICNLFLDFKESEQSKIFPNAAFGYWKVIVERPLRLHSQLTQKTIESLRFASGDREIRAQLYEEFHDALSEDFPKVKNDLEGRLSDWGATDEEEESSPRKGLPEKTKKKLLDEKTWKRDAMLVNVAKELRRVMGDRLFTDHNKFRSDVDAAVKESEIKISPADLNVILKAVSWREDTAPPVIAKIHKPGKIKIDPLHGLYEVKIDGQKAVIEYEPDSNLRDIEHVPLLEEGGIETFFCREVLPNIPDAWINESAKIGYEISFTRYFYKPKPLRTVEEIRGDIMRVEKETEGLISRVVTRGLGSNVRLKPSGIDWLGDVPEHWNIVKMRSLIRPINIRNRPDLPLLSVIREKGIIPRAGQSDEENRNIIPEDLTNYKVVRPGNLVVNKMKAWQGSVGVSDLDGIVSPAYFVYQISSKVNGKYLHYLLRSRHYIDLMLRISDGVRPGQWDLDPVAFKQIPIPIPPSSEQVAIVNQIEKAIVRIISEIEKIKKEIDLIQEYRTRLITEIVTGKVDVRCLEITEDLPISDVEI